MASVTDHLADEQSTAFLVYQFAASLAKFRSCVESSYVDACDPAEGKGDSLVPAPIFDRFRELQHHANCLEWSLAIPGLTDLIDAARSIREIFESVWLKAEHRDWIAWRSGLSKSEATPEHLDSHIIKNSPFAPPTWAQFEGYAEQVAFTLPELYQALFTLSRHLSGVCYPPLSSYDPRLSCHPLFNVDDYLLPVLNPLITRLMHEVRKKLHVLETVDEKLGLDAYSDAVKLHDEILLTLDLNARKSAKKSLKKRSTDTVVTERELIPVIPPEGATTEQEGSETPQTPTNGQTTPKDSSEEAADVAEIEKLEKLKERLDKKEQYIGKSLPVLRMFKQIEDVNRRSDEPLIILGPSGVGKTALAKIIHDASPRGSRPFKHLQANDVAGGDETIVRDKWVGRGLHAGLSKGEPNTPVLGWLQENAGGTIFLDELHNLDTFNQEFLRKVLDRHPIPFAAGKGQDVTPDVRLIFATFRDFGELSKNRVLVPDFVRRLGTNFLVVPSLNDRREDIPLFVKKFEDGRKPAIDFMLALLWNDWKSGEVDKLIKAVKAAVGRKDVGERITAADLKGKIPDEVINRVVSMKPNEVKKQGLSILLEIFGDQSNGRQKRVADFFDVSEATASRWFQQAGLGKPVKPKPV